DLESVDPGSRHSVPYMWGTNGIGYKDVGARFEAYNWHVQHVDDGNDIEAIDDAITAAKAETEKPSLIIVNTDIAYGSPLQDDADSHGAPLGEENIRAAKENLGWPPDENFHVPEAALDHMRDAVQRGEDAQQKWTQHLAECRVEAPATTEELMEVLRGELPSDWDLPFKVFTPDDGPMATRNASGDVIEVLADKLPTLIGGSGDLAPSTKTIMDDYGEFTPEEAGRNIRFGVREHAMAAAVNGMALHGGIIPFGATFIVFSDYMRPSLRLAAIMECKSIFIFTHDSIGVGEDGPTHQGIEQVMSLRAMPGFTMLRPADANETVGAWRIAVECDGPAAMALTRQKLPVLDVEKYPVQEGVAKGAYILEAADGDPDIVLMATGSEVHLAMDAAAALRDDDISVRVVSMPCWEIFDEQPEEYQREVLPPGVPKLAIEAGSTLGWQKYVGDNGDVIGLDRFGASAPGDILMDKLGFNVNNVVKHARALLQ
ncbi:MAG: transketolase C-terminal domain-containing protein, partial [Armatimonadota bacterium]